MRIGIQLKTIAAVFGMFSLVAILFIFTYSFTKDSLRLLTRSSQQTFPVLETLDQVLVQTREYQDALRSAVGTNDEFALEDSAMLAESIIEKFEKVKEIDPGLASTTDDTIRMFKSYTEESEQTVRKPGRAELFSHDSTLMDFMQAQETTVETIRSFRRDSRAV